MKNYYKRIIIGLCCFSLILSCSKFIPGLPPDTDILDGPVDGLTYAQNAQFLAGDKAFNDEVFNTTNGLGPIFVATSCGSCHAGDGKGTPFTTLTRFGQSDESGNKFLHLGGPQLQNRAIPGYTPESIPAGATFSKFTPPANTGLGFIELVSDSSILALADPNDINGDGISGVPNWRPLASYLTPAANAITQNGKYIHRFGKKAAAYNLLNQTVNAYNQDMGISSLLSPTDILTGNITDPEVSLKTIENVVAYLQMLKAPIQRDPSNARVLEGKKVFAQIGCENCHKENLTTGYSPVEALSYKTFHPYTDLLLHDMGSQLDDKYTEGSAKTYEWRTPALWGLGLSPNSQGGMYYLMHDGRATSMEAAIGMHGGEATNSVTKYNLLSQTQKESLILFLKSL
ncbi:MAG: di-heme oxidoredictase family protein [Bacteroidota bacterium]|nr:di-heme oxidoredictase family protein [Bacteroidota bacterium]